MKRRSDLTEKVWFQKEEQTNKPNKEKQTRGNETPFQGGKQKKKNCTSLYGNKIEQHIKVGLRVTSLTCAQAVGVLISIP